MGFLTNFVSKYYVHTIVTIILAVVVGYGSQFLLGKDNPVEQAAESVIKQETGKDVDLSPK